MRLVDNQAKTVDNKPFGYKLVGKRYDIIIVPWKEVKATGWDQSRIDSYIKVLRGHLRDKGTLEFTGSPSVKYDHTAEGWQFFCQEAAKIDELSKAIDALGHLKEDKKERMKATPARRAQWTSDPEFDGNWGLEAWDAIRKLADRGRHLSGSCRKICELMDQIELSKEPKATL